MASHLVVPVTDKKLSSVDSPGSFPDYPYLPLDTKAPLNSQRRLFLCLFLLTLSVLIWACVASGSKVGLPDFWINRLLLSSRGLLRALYLLRRIKMKERKTKRKKTSTWRDSNPQPQKILLMKRVVCHFATNQKPSLRGGLHSTEVAFLLLTQQPRVHFPSFKKCSVELSDVPGIHWQHCLE